jgi:hypothetical protein
MARVRADKFRPDWDTHGVYKRYAQKLIQKDLWKYAKLGFTQEDMMQEAWCCFDFCVHKYTVKEPRHFMALYKRRIFCQFWLLARASFRESFIVHGKPDDENSSKIDVETIGRNLRDYNSGPLKVLLEEAPQEIKAVVNAIVNAPSDLVDEFFSNNIVTNKDICRFFGYNPKKDLGKALGYRKAKIEKMNLLDLFKDYFTS